MALFVKKKKGGRHANEDLTSVFSEWMYNTFVEKQTHMFKPFLSFLCVHLKTMLKEPSVQACQIVLRSSSTMGPSIYLHQFTAS